jgi:hypothetical protein
LPDPNVSTANWRFSPGGGSDCRSLPADKMTSSPPLSPGFAKSLSGPVPLLTLCVDAFDVIVLDNEFAAFCAAENIDEKKPPAACGAVSVPPGVFTSSGAGVNGTEVALDNLLGPLVADLMRRCVPP